MSEGDGRAKAGHEHASEDALIAARRAKAERIRARPAGDDNRPFANDVCARTPGGPDEGPAPLGEVHRACAGALTDAAKRRYDPAKVEPRPFRVAGRVLFMRSFGGISFVRLRDRTGELQLFVEETSPCAARLEDIDLGDVVEATGVAIATQKGELSIRPERLRVLTKAYRPLPTKTSFKDVESRYRQRYVDLVANPDVMAVFKARTRIVAAVRKFLDARGFYEVETPTMVSLIGGAAAKPFSTHHNALGLDLYLRIAPELFLKRLVVGGIERVYEVARCYRNEGLSTRHNPEFTMLEYYQAYATYETLMDQTEQMLRFVDDELGADPELGAEHEAWRAKRSWSFERFVRLPMHEGIARALEAAGLPAEVPARVAAADAPIKDWAKAAKANKRDIDWTNYRTGAKKCDSPGELVFCAYEYLVEPFLPRDYRTTDGQKSVPVFVIDYPFEVSPLARKKDADPALVDRFELFVDGRELCNAFSELNDPDDQADRFRAQVARKQKGDEEAMDFDADYVRALEHGMPPAAGFGMGVDRLTMLLTGAASIRDVILFPLLRPEAG